MRLLFAIFASAIFLVSPFELSAQVSNTFEAKFVEELRLKYPDFRIVKKMEVFPERYNASVDLHIRAATPGGSNSNRALVTLHDATTGEPLESCFTPCVLHKSPGRPVFAFPYKYGHFTFPYAIEFDPAEMKAKYPYWDNDYEVQLGPDFHKAHFRKVMCEREFKKMDRSDRDAEPCYRMPPPIQPLNYSGYCRLEFDVTPKGDVTNDRIIECSDSAFEITSQIAVRAWKYHPKIERGMAVTRPGVKTKLKYDVTDFDKTLLDENGKRVEE